MEPRLLLGAAATLAAAGLLRLATDTYGEKRPGALLILGVAILCAALGVREMAF